MRPGALSVEPPDCCRNVLRGDPWTPSCRSAVSTTRSSSRDRWRRCARSTEQRSNFPLHRELGPKWIEFRVGSNILALTEHGARFDDPPPPIGVLSLQLAFRVAPGEVAGCASLLRERGVTIISGPTDQPFGHRTLFFRDPDGNVLEIYAEI